MKLNFYETLVDADIALRKRGFTDQFVLKEGKLENVETGKSYLPTELVIREFHRFEGMSNPSDSAIVFAVSANDDDAKGTIVMNYSTDAEMDLINFMDQVKIEIPEYSY